MPARNEDANTAAHFLLHHWKLHFGAPEVLVSDRGNAFISEVLKRIRVWTQTKQIFTCGYVPRSNGQTEVRNNAIQLILRKISHENGDDWNKLLQAALRVYNTTPSSTTNQIADDNRSKMRTAHKNEYDRRNSKGKQFKQGDIVPLRSSGSRRDL